MRSQSSSGARLPLRLFLSFFKIGLFTFGGGYAMIPFIQREAVEKRHWISEEDILEIVAIAESTPGPIAVNAATFVGYRTAGAAGAAAATFGVVLPSYLIILLVYTVLTYLLQFAVVRYAFAGIRAGVLALILKALVSLFKKCPKNKLSIAVMAGAFAAVAFWNLHVLIVIGVCAVCGLTVSLLSARKETRP